MIKSKLPIMAVLMFAFAAALPASAEGPNITIVAPTATTTAELTQSFQITSDKPLKSAAVEIGMINGGFEDGNLNEWSTGGDAPWVVATNTLPWGNAAKIGGYFAHSPLAGSFTSAEATSWIERTIVTRQTSTIGFWAKAYLRYGNDVVFTMDGVELDRFTTTNIASWTKKEYQIPAGVHVMRFSYNRTVDQDASYEAFLLDQFRWRDVVYSQSLAVANPEGSGAASGNVVLVPGEFDYRVVGVDTDDNFGASPISKIKVYSSPKIYFYGANPLTISIDDIGSYKDAGAFAIDMLDGDVSASLSYTKEGFGSLGPSYIRYTARNSAGGVGAASRTLNVVDLTPPVITLNGDAVTTTEKFSSYDDPGASAADNCTGPHALQLTTSSDLDVNTEGTYHIVYSTTDEFGNTGHATRTINVIDTLPPRIYGVENGANYAVPVYVQFDEGTGLLNGIAFASGTTIDVEGSYTLVVADSHGFSTTVSFNIVFPTSGSGGGSSTVSSGGGGGGSSSGGGSTIVYTEPTAPVALPQSMAQVLGVKYSSTTKVATAKIKLKANGTLIRDSEMKVYILVGGKKKLIASLSELSKYKNKKIYDVADAEAALYPEWRPYAAGVLLKAKTGEIYFTLKNGNKLQITSTSTLKLLAKVKTYKNVSAANLAYYPLGSTDSVSIDLQTDWRPYAVNVLLRTSDGTIYLTKKGGILHKVLNLEEFKKYRRYKMYSNVTAEALSFYTME